MPSWRRRFDAAFFRREWNIGVLDAFSFDPRAKQVARGARWFDAPSAPYFAADPFLIEEGNRRWILSEVKTSPLANGAIAAWQLCKDEVKYCGMVIAEPGIHLSYPFTFRWAGEVYCVPERSEAGSPTLYRAKHLPDQWQPIASQMPRAPLVDPTFFEHDRRWWLAATDAATGPQSHLSLWHGASPLGPWTPHRGNPVKCDPSSARPAGAPFVYGGNLYRPAQDNSRGYGGRIVFNRVLELTPETFREWPEGGLEPDATGPYPRGVHTVCVSGGFLLMDGLKVRPHPQAPFDFVCAVVRSRRNQRRDVTAT